MINYSVIIPHFSKKGTELLFRAVESVPVRDDIEVIVVDNSLIPIDEKIFFNRNQIHVYFSDNRLGAGGARNKGIEQAKGKWLLFMDADDYFTKDAFDQFDKCLESDNDIVFFKSTSVFSDTGEFAQRHMQYNYLVENFLKDKNDVPLRLDFSVPWSKMIRSSLVKDNYISFEEIPASNDVIFSLNIGLKAKKIIAIDQIVYCVTVNKGSITNTLSLPNIESIFGVCIRKNAILRQYGYKASASVMYQVYRSAYFGFVPCVNLIWKALITGNLFVGWNNWLNTCLCGINEYKGYVEKELNFGDRAGENNK